MPKLKYTLERVCIPKSTHDMDKYMRILCTHTRYWNQYIPESSTEPHSLPIPCEWKRCVYSSHQWMPHQHIWNERSESAAPWIQHRLISSKKHIYISQWNRNLLLLSFMWTWEAELMNRFQCLASFEWSYSIHVVVYILWSLSSTAVFMFSLSLFCCCFFTCRCHVDCLFHFRHRYGLFGHICMYL